MFLHVKSQIYVICYQQKLVLPLIHSLLKLSVYLYALHNDDNLSTSNQWHVYYFYYTLANHLQHILKTELFQLYSTVSTVTILLESVGFCCVLECSSVCFFAKKSF